jgi:hypothetical protein
MTTPDTPAWLNVDAIVPAILRDDVPELLRAAETMLEAVVAYIDLVPEGDGSFRPGRGAPRPAEFLHV